MFDLCGGCCDFLVGFCAMGTTGTCRKSCHATSLYLTELITKGKSPYKDGVDIGETSIRRRVFVPFRRGGTAAFSDHS